MKTKILIPVVSVVLFATSVVGLLAIQGRLNYQGTRGVPVVSLLFSPPHDAEGTGKSGEAGKDGGVGAAGVGAESAPADPKAAEHSGKGEQAGADEGTTEGAQAAATADHAVPNEDGHGRPDSGPSQPKFPATFLYPPIQGRLNAEEIMAAAIQIEDKRRKLELDRAQMDFEKEALAVRERDVEERRKAVRNDMALVQSKSDELEKRIKDFETSAALLKRQEQKNFKEQAEKLSLMDPKKAAEYLIEFGPEGEDRAVKLMANMDAESAARILESMDPKRGARLVERGLRLVREGGGS